MKIRTPYTPENTLQAIIRQLKVPVADIADVCGKSESMIYKLADPDEDAKIHCETALVLDQVCLKLTNAAPFAELFHKRAELFGARTSRIFGLPEAVLHVQGAIGDLSSHVAGILQEPRTSRAHMSPTKRQQLLIDVNVLRKMLDDVERAVLMASAEENKTTA